MVAAVDAGAMAIEAKAAVVNGAAAPRAVVALVAAMTAAGARIVRHQLKHAAVIVVPAGARTGAKPIKSRPKTASRTTPSRV